MVCINCNNKNNEGSRFCVHCGAQLHEMTSKMTDRKAKHSGKTGKISVLLLSAIPIFGLLAALFLTLKKLKREKIKIVALTVAFITTNSFTTLFTYTSVVLFMKNSLAQAAYMQSPGEQKPSIQTPSPGQNYAKDKFGAASTIPGTDMFSISGINVISSIYPDSYNMDNIKGSTSQGEKNTINRDIHKIPADILLPGGTKSIGLPKVDDDDCIYFDMDNDGKNDVKCDAEGNMFYDSDGDGVYETKYEQEYSEGAVSE